MAGKADMASAALFLLSLPQESIDARLRVVQAGAVACLSKSSFLTSISVSISTQHGED